MNKEQYNNIINRTLANEPAAQAEDSLATTRAIFKNMGVAIPNGSMKEVYETIKTDDYMGWRACTREEALQAAKDGIATIGINEEQIVVIASPDADEPNEQSAFVTMLVEEEVTDGNSAMEYHAYSAATTTVSYTNNLFNPANRDALLAELTQILGERHDPVSHYTREESLDLVLSYDSAITGFCNLYNVPKQLVQSLLLREIWCVNATDDVADDLVMNYYQYMRELEIWRQLPLAEQIFATPPQPPEVIHKDSSTGIGQMFAWVAIDAHNLAVDKNLIVADKYDKTDWHDIEEIWNKLHSDPIFAIEMVTLEMYHCADYARVTGSMFECSEDKIKAILARYNGTNDAAKANGELCYGYYQLFVKYV